jgi:hypothetical protein
MHFVLIVGACNVCEICGIVHAKQTLYMGAVRELPPQHTLRDAFREEFKRVPTNSPFHVVVIAFCHQI